MSKRWFMPLLAGLMVMAGCATQQQRAERREQVRKAVTEAVARRQLRIDITSMSTLRYGSPDFFLELRGDTLRSYLPYLGQAYQAPMPSPLQGLNFEAPILSMSEGRAKSDMSRLEIDVKTDEDSFVYTVEVWDTGKAYIRVRSQHRDPISFDGEVAVP